MQRGWYGRVRGNDAIFSFHPIEPSSISYNGADQQVRFRQSFVHAGMIEKFNITKHREDFYQELSR